MRSLKNINGAPRANLRLGRSLVAFTHLNMGVCATIRLATEVSSNRAISCVGEALLVLQLMGANEIIFR